jgi:hypothetical protein
LNVLGAGGTTTISPVLNNVISLQGAPFGTNAVAITGISTNVVYVPSLDTTGAAFTLNLTTNQLLSATEATAEGVVIEINTLTINGYNNLMSASQAGAVMMVSPFRIKTGDLGGNIPGALRKTFTWRVVPEPTTNLLISIGALVLAALARHRSRL